MNVKLTVQKRLAAQVLNCSPKRVRFDSAGLEEVKEAITKADIRGLVGDGIIYAIPKRSTSRGRARNTLGQKRKGRQKGRGSRKGTKNARLPEKTEWMNKIRLQRSILKNLKSKQLITNETYTALYKRAGSGYFRSRRHLNLYLGENKLLRENKQEQEQEK